VTTFFGIAPSATGPIWISVFAAIAGAAIGWWLARRRGMRDRALSSVLEHTDCLLWQAETTFDGDNVTWSISLQPTALSRRLFQGRLVPTTRGLWIGWELPEQAEMDLRSRTAMQRGDPGYEQEFCLTVGEKVVWLRETVAIQSVAANRFWLVGIVTDITSQREAEIARRTSEERLTQLLGRADLMLWQAHVKADENGVFSWEFFLPKSELYQRIKGGTAGRENWLWDRSMVPEFDQLEACSHAAMLERRTSYEQEFRVIVGGNVMWVHEHVSIREAGEQQWVLDGTVIDITARRHAEELKQASEAQLQRVLETADFLLWHAKVLLTASGEFQWRMHVPRSRLHQRVFGREVNDPSLMPWRELVSPDVYDEMVKRADGAILSGAPGYDQTIRGERDGITLWLNESATIQRAGPTEWNLVGIVTDITKAHEAEEARQASERALREILERAECMLWHANVECVDGALKWSNFSLPASKLCTELFGRHMPSGGKIWRLIEVPDLAEMNARSTQAILSGASGYEQDFRAKRDGRLFHLHEQASIRPTGPHSWQLVGVITDVTARYTALEAQRQSEVRLDELLRRADCLIWQGQLTRNPDGKFTWKIYAPKSQLYRRLFGRDPGDGGFRWDLLQVPEVAEMNSTAEQAVESGATGYENIFCVPKPEGSIWINEQVTITPTGIDRWELVGVMMDITARREAEESKRQTEAQLRSILELADCMVWQATVTDGHGRLAWKTFTPYSYMYRRLFGAQAWDGSLDWGRVNVPEYSEIQARSSVAIRERRAGYDQEFRVITPERVIWLREVVTILPAEGDECRLVGVITDITPQREAQEAKRASVAQVEQLLGSADCMLWQARVFEISPGAFRWVMFLPKSHLHRELFDRDPSYPFTLGWGEIVDPATVEEIAARADQAIRSSRAGYEQEFRAQRDDRVFWLHESVTITVVGPGEWELVGIVTDLSARRAAEQAVHASEERFRTLYQHSPVAIVETDFSEVGQWYAELRARGVTDLGAYFEQAPSELVRAARKVRFVDCNDAAMTMLKAKRKAEFRHRRGILGTPESLGTIKAVFIAVWEGRNSLEAGLQLRDFAGDTHEMSERWWMERGAEELDLSRAVMVFVDLTELKRAELALAGEKERLAVTFRAMAEGVITTDIQGRVQFMNQAAAAFTRSDPSLVIGKPVDEVCDFSNDRTGEKVEIPVGRVAQGDILVELPARTRLAGSDGKIRLFEGCCAPVRSLKSEVIGIVLVFRDVTEHERLEQELVRATKLESVGILAGGIAHDFNNILTAVMGNIALAALDTDANSEAGRSLRQAERATLRARDLTQQLLTFAKGGEPVRTSVHLDAVVREMTAFTLHGSNVRAVFEIAADLWPADADKAQIGRVVQNLVLNAVQAMPDGGTVKVKLSNERVPGLASSTLVPGDYVQIAISDTGTGIKPEHVSRIFDPYFTTKPKGSGLGLATAYSIVTKHRGAVDIQTELGKGTTFRIWLPATATHPAEAGPAVRPDHAAKLGGRLLFMDDEEPIRQMAAFLLRRFGFEVVCANDGADAVAKFRAAREGGKPFTLVIMDLTVPGGIGGREAIVELKKIDPAVRAIVSSGYSSDPVLANYRAHGFAGVAAKPYDVNELARVLREVTAA